MYENLAYDENGQFLAGSLMDYLYPSSMEVPPMEIAHFETPSVVTEGGIKDRPDNSGVDVNSVKSKANLITYKLGVSIGL